MIRHITIAALRSMMASPLVSAIAVLGLSAGIAAALLAALVVRNQLSFDHFVAGYDRTYLVRSEFRREGFPRPLHSDGSPELLAAAVKAGFAQVEEAARMMPPRHPSNRPVITLSHGLVTGDEIAYWADPDIFRVLPLPVFRGDVNLALRRPDGIVLTRAVARKYFGRDDAVGQTILADGHPMVVGAVIADFPANATSFNGGVFASGLAAFSPLAADLSDNVNPVVTYLRLRPGAQLDDLRGWAETIDRRFRRQGIEGYALQPIRLDRIAFLDPETRPRMLAAALTGALILLVAAINFVNLLTARAGHRAREVGMRKACGAGRAALMLQFLGEAILIVLFATCTGLALCEWLVPWVNAFLGTGATLAELQTPAGLGLLLAFVILLGLAAGAWPAFALSAFRPAAVLKNLLPRASAGDVVRSALVVLQFAMLIGLAVAAAVIYQQQRFAARDSLHGDINGMLVIRGGCNPAFRAEVRKLAGVAGAACTDITFFEGMNEMSVRTGGRQLSFTPVTLDPGIFALYGIRPLAGSLPLPSAASDRQQGAVPRLVLNASAVKRFGFASAQAAIGRTPPGYRAPPSNGAERGPPGTVIAVVPDFSFHPLTNAAITPTLYTTSSNPFGNDSDMVSVRLRPGQVPETLAGIDRLWAASNPGTPVSRFFLDAYMQDLYQGLLRQAQLFAIFSGVAVLLSCLGLLGLSLSAAERRTKEIGVRKAMGAGDGQIVALLLWQFSRPVLWANLVAWPFAWWLMRRWLSRYAYHVELHWWVFAGAGLGALAIALITVAGHAWLAARARPVLALRYE